MIHISFFLIIFALAMDEISLINERNAALKAEYQRIFKDGANLRYAKLSTIISILQEQPAPRFYVTPEWAGVLIKRWYRNHGCKNKRKRQMVQDLVQNFERLQRMYPDAKKTTLYQLATEQPAKSFYMSTHRIMEILLNYSGR